MKNRSTFVISSLFAVFAILSLEAGSGSERHRRFTEEQMEKNLLPNRLTYQHLERLFDDKINQGSSGSMAEVWRFLGKQTLPLDYERSLLQVEVIDVISKSEIQDRRYRLQENDSPTIVSTIIYPSEKMQPGDNGEAVKMKPEPTILTKGTFHFAQEPNHITICATHPEIKNTRAAIFVRRKCRRIEGGESGFYDLRIAAVFHEQVDENKDGEGDLETCWTIVDIQKGFTHGGDKDRSD